MRVTWAETLYQLARSRRTVCCEQVGDTPTPGRRVLLIDLDNIGLVPLPVRAAALRALCEAAGPVEASFACGRDVNYAGWKAVCDQLGIRTVLACPVPDGADQTLLEVARSYADLGITDFVIASSDHIFAQLPGRITTVHRSTQLVSAKLLLALTEVVAVDFDQLAGVERSRYRSPAVRESRRLARQRRRARQRQFAMDALAATARAEQELAACS